MKDLARQRAMELTVEATYENGVLKPASPLPLAEHERVRVTITDDGERRLAAVRATAGLVGWKGDPATIERVALDPEFGKREAP